MRNLGKEDMLASIAKYFQTWVVVTPNYYESLQVLEMPNVFTDNPEAGYIFAVPFQVSTSWTLQYSFQQKIYQLLLFVKYVFKSLEHISHKYHRVHVFSHAAANNKETSW